MAIAVAVLVFLGVLMVVAMPLLQPAAASASGWSPADELENERQRLLEAIRDADMDLALGKVTAEDHAAVRRSLEEQAIGVLAQIERAASQGPG